MLKGKIKAGVGLTFPIIFCLSPCGGGKRATGIYLEGKRR